MSWARLLALVFVISTTISALLSIFILDEYDHVSTYGLTSLTSTPSSTPRAWTLTLRHSLLSHPAPQLTPSMRRTDNVKDSTAKMKARIQFEHRRDAYDAAIKYELPSRRKRIDNTTDTSNAIDIESMTTPITMPVESIDDIIESFDSPPSLPDLYTEFNSTPSTSSVPSTYFFGSAVTFSSISLWHTFFTEFVGVDIKSWDVDTSNIKPTWSVQSDESNNEIEMQKQVREEHKRIIEKRTAEKDSVFNDIIANDSSQLVRPTPIVSVLHSLKSHQGITPFVSLSRDSTTMQLVLVHSFFSNDDNQDVDDDTRDSRGEGLIEWFTRPTATLFYPLQMVQRKDERNSDVDSSSSLIDFADVSLWDVAHLFADSTSLPQHEHGIASGIGATLPSQFSTHNGGGTSRSMHRVQIPGDWMLRSYERVAGVIHAQAATNFAGGGKESQWLVVAYEQAIQGQDENDDTEGEAFDARTVLTIFMDPPSASSTDSSIDNVHPDIVLPSSTRVRVSIPLHTLRVVTAITLVASRSDLRDASTHAELTILYSLRGDRRVFRSIHVRADRRSASDDEDEQALWDMSWTTGSAGPPAKRTGFISQTVALQAYSGDDDSNNTESRNSSSSPIPPLKVIASELNWAMGAVVLAGPVASGATNKWHHQSIASSSTSATSSTKRKSNKSDGMHMQNVPPFTASIYSHNSSSSSDSLTTVGWRLDKHISSSKSVGKYGVNAHPLSVHRGSDGVLAPLVVASSASNRFVAFAQVPLITTVDKNDNFDPIEIVHLEQDTTFAALAFNDDGTILAVLDNRNDIILLHRSLQSANANDTINATTTMTNVSSSPSTTSTSLPARKRHQWEVLMEMNLPRRLKRLSLLSVQIVDVPVPGIESEPSINDDANGSSMTTIISTSTTTPLLLFLFQGGVVASMQLRPVGVDSSYAHTNDNEDLQLERSNEGIIESIVDFFLNNRDYLILGLSFIIWLACSIPRRLAHALQQHQQQQAAAAAAAADGAPLPVAPPGMGLIRHLLFAIDAQHQQRLAQEQQQQQQPALLLNPLLIAARAPAGNNANQFESAAARAAAAAADAEARAAAEAAAIISVTEAIEAAAAREEARELARETRAASRIGARPRTIDTQSHHDAAAVNDATPQIVDDIVNH